MSNDDTIDKYQTLPVGSGQNTLEMQSFVSRAAAQAPTDADTGDIGNIRDIVNDNSAVTTDMIEIDANNEQEMDRNKANDDFKSRLDNDGIDKNNINNNNNDILGGYKQVSKIGDAIIRLRNIHKTYLLGLEGVPALRGVSLTIHKGEFIVILGKSGGGKTSMLNIMGTIDKPTKGDLYIDGKRISSQTTDSEVANIRLKKIGFCFQTFNLISSMTALENVELPLILDGQLSASAIKERSQKLLDHMGLTDRYSHLPSQLSGGEQQRVTIARAIANNPSVLLLDEPTGDLDTKNSNIVMDVLVRLNRTEGITCVFVTHDVSLKYFAHRVIHMLDGKISRIENISEIKRKQAERELKNSLNLGKAEISIENTEIREPSDFYSYHRWVKHHHGAKFRNANFDENGNIIEDNENENDSKNRENINNENINKINNNDSKPSRNQSASLLENGSKDDSNSNSKKKGEDSVIPVDSSQSGNITNGVINGSNESPNHTDESNNS